MPEKIRISVVSYLNSKPFIYGINHSPIVKKIDLSEDTPADCALKLMTNKVDLGLIPIAAMPAIQNAQIVSDYCIGAKGSVNSVFLFSNSPVQNLAKIWLDLHSRTSNNLCRILCNEYWNVNPLFEYRKTDIPLLQEQEGMVLIGDRTFGLYNRYEYCYDLSEAWFDMTKLPFVFAAWVSNSLLDDSFVKEFNQALKMGLEERNEVIKMYKNDVFDVKDYLMNRIDFLLDDLKREAIALFLTYAKWL